MVVAIIKIKKNPEQQVIWEGLGEFACGHAEFQVPVRNTGISNRQMENGALWSSLGWRPKQGTQHVVVNGMEIYVTMKTSGLGIQPQRKHVWEQENEVEGGGVKRERNGEETIRKHGGGGMIQCPRKKKIKEEDGQYGQAMGRIMEIRPKKGTNSFMNTESLVIFAREISGILGTEARLQ